MITLFRAALLTVFTALPAQASDLTVFAAASLGDVIDSLSRAWTVETGVAVTVALAGSSALARQVDAGAPADVIVLASEDWMVWLRERDRLLPDTERFVASNRLVLVANGAGVPSDEPITETTDLPAMLGPDGRLALALPDAVPAGIYAREALTALGLWGDIEGRLAPTDNVRAALALVALGEAPLGVVYATDAAAEPKVHVAGVFPQALHAPILYPAAVVADTDRPDAAQDFVTWLSTDPAQAILGGYGFLPVGGHP